MTIQVPNVPAATFFQNGEKTLSSEEIKQLELRLQALEEFSLRTVKGLKEQLDSYRALVAKQLNGGLGGEQQKEKVISLALAEELNKILKKAEDMIKEVFNQEQHLTAKGPQPKNQI